MEPWMGGFDQMEPEDFYHSLLTDVLDDLMDQVGGSKLTKIDKVKKATRKISQRYTVGLSSQSRCDWSVPANRCAYVFVYLMQHCHLMSYSLQKTSTCLRSWRTKKEVLKVCSIGGGPGSDLVGLTTFLRKKKIFPTSHLECLVLDRYPEWKQTWDKIDKNILEDLKVKYEKCDVVRDKDLTVFTRQFIKQADMLTLSKFFSAVSAFFRDDRGKGDLLRLILRDIKPDCFVLYIDNNDRDNQFEQEFASPAGLRKMAEFRDTITLSIGQYSDTLAQYHVDLDYNPLRSCDVLIQLYEKSAV